jgi:hypothetical protein
MKNVITNGFLIVTIFLVSTNALFGQDDEEASHKFKRENIFFGGAIGLGLGSGGFSVGANPEIGYSVAQWLDAGVAFNLNYYSFAAEYNGGISQKSFNYGAGVFVRLYPIRNVFLQVLPEFNRINTTLKDLNFGSSAPETKYNQEGPSMLLGIGYTSREIGRSSFYTVLMFDAGNSLASPYIGYLGTKLPILRTGFNFYLRPRRQSPDREY